MLPEDLV